MEYTLRYYKIFPQPGKRDILLEIYEKDGVRPSQEIGSVVQALHLDIQGAQDDIDTPIVKTSLTMVFVDAPDHEESATKKCGNWEEFYTPDSTYWQVILKVRNSQGEFTQIWGGYVTPDSFSEQLRYRGSVTIVARDNIGHMQDFPFDAKGNEDGMITVYDLVNAAWSKIDSPMRIDWRGVGDSAIWLQSEGTEAPATYVNVSAFEGMNWYEAVQKVLYSMGMVMRYVGKNVVQVSSLRYMPYMGKESISDLNVIEPIFVSSANRELAPAAKRIEESVSYHLDKGVQIPLAKAIEFTGEENSIPFYSTNIFGETVKTNIPVHPIANTSGEGWSNIPSSTLFFNPREYTIREEGLKEDVKRMIYVACNTDGSHSAIYRDTVVCQSFRISLTFGRVIQRLGTEVLYCYGFASGTENNGIGSIRVRKVSGYITVEQNGITQYFTGERWQNDPYRINIEDQGEGIGINIGFQNMTGQAIVSFIIDNVELNAMWDYSDGDGLYVPISSMYWGIMPAQSLCETNNVNTVYIDSNNVIIDRSPELAPALDDVPFPAIIKNGIFVKSGSAYLPAKGWSWSGGTPQQMAVYNHLQLLCYHSKPNNIISGDIVNADFVDMATIYKWGGADHLLLSGSYNFLNGRIEGAVIREFKYYDDMWSDISGAEVPNTEQNNKTTAETGGTPNASTYNNKTTVNIGSSGGGGGSTTLAGLDDVKITDLKNDQYLMYDSGIGKWANRNLPDFPLLKGVKIGTAEANVILTLDAENRSLKIDGKAYTTGQFAAGGKATDGSGGGGGANIMLLTEWDDSLSNLEEYALGANLGKELKDEVLGLKNGLKSNPQSFFSLKTINNESLFGSGNIQVKTTVDATDIRNAVFTGTSSQFLKGDGSLDSNAYVITNARSGNIDINQIYDSSIWGLGLVTNAPYNYGAVLTMAYRKPMGNAKPDYAAQIFLPAGDIANADMKYRTSHADYWNSWRTVIDDSNIGSYTLRIGVRETSGNANEINEAGIIGFTENLANTPFLYGNLLTITTNPNYYVGQIAIQYNGTMAVRGRSASTWSDWQTVLTPSNIGNYALSQSGGRLSNSTTTVLVVDSTSGREAGIRFTLSDVSKGWVGYNTNDGVHLYSYGTGNNILGIKDNGTPHYSGKTLIHEGNIREYNAGGLAHSNGTVGAVVNSSGNVGIGTESPQYKLDVAGTGRFTGLASFDAGVKIGTTTLGNTDLGLSINTSFYPSISNSLSLGHSSYRWYNVYAKSINASEKIKIGDATIEWDSAKQALRVDCKMYTIDQLAAGGAAV